MQNLIAFLVRYRKLLLFILLELLAFSFLLQHQSFQRSKVVHSARAWTAEVLASRAEFNQYLKLKETNQHLVEENASLKTLLQTLESPLAQGDSLMLWSGRDSLNARTYRFMSAWVVKNSFHKRNNYLTLNKGEAHGVKPGMGVVCSQGVVGIVRDVSPHFCTVLSVLHKDAMISARLGNSRHFGSLVWPGESHRSALLQDIPKEAEILVGDSLFTNAYSAVFPPGVPLGLVSDFTLPQAANFYEIQVQLSTDFSRLDYVYIVENMMQEEQLELEEIRANE